LPQPVEAGQSVGAALDQLALVDDAFGVAVGGRLTGQSRDTPLRGKRFIEVREPLMALFFGDGEAG
jgi:hypothetical protein